MKKILKRLLKAVAVILIIVVLITLFKDGIARVILSRGVKALTGLKLGIKDVYLGIATTTLDVKDLKVFNPPSYEDKVMADVPQIYIDYDLGSFFEGKIHLEHLELDLRELVVVKNEKGELNLRRLKVVKSKKQDTPPKAKKQETKESRFQIDILDLKVGKVIYKDYSKGIPPAVKEWEINIDERYKDIDQPTKLAKVILVRALVHTSISKLAHFDLKPLEEGVNSILKGVTKITTDTAKEAVKEGVGAGKKAIKGAAQEVEKIFRIKK